MGTTSISVFVKLNKKLFLYPDETETLGALPVLSLSGCESRAGHLG